MSNEFLGAIVAMILGIVWATLGFGSAIGVAILGLLGYMLARYGKRLVTPIMSELMSMLNIEQKKK